MLKKTQKIKIEGESLIGEVSAAGFRAEIDSENPEKMTLSVWQNDKPTYKANRDAVRADQAEFEDYAYTVQDQLISEK